MARGAPAGLIPCSLPFWFQFRVRPCLLLYLHVRFTPNLHVRFTPSPVIRVFTVPVGAVGSLGQKLVCTPAALRASIDGYAEGAEGVGSDEEASSSENQQQSLEQEKSNATETSAALSP